MAEQRYRVLDRLEAGGMAEVFLGEAVGNVADFRKKVAIKRVLPHLAQNKKFISMFLDEARLGAKLNHSNIVTVFDIGAADATYFIVMEFVDGGNLKSLQEVLRAQGRRIPVPAALLIAIETCKGLSYAHELVDEADAKKPLHIVHRDVSPPNILLTRRGEVKVADFGLAKATTQLEKTDPGVVKGKFSYLSPEAAHGNPVDARADVFSLGAVLWEMLAGKRLFFGDNDYQTVKLVQEGRVPSIRAINPQVDAECERIILKSLAKDVDQRFQTARAFADELANYLFNNRMKVTSYDLEDLVSTVAARKDAEKSKARRATMIDIMIEEELLRFRSLDDIEESSPSPGAQPLMDLARMGGPRREGSGTSAATRGSGSFANGLGGRPRTSTAPGAEYGSQAAAKPLTASDFPSAFQPGAGAGPSRMPTPVRIDQRAGDATLLTPIAGVPAVPSVHKSAAPGPAQGKRGMDRQLVWLWVGVGTLGAITTGLLTYLLMR